MNPYNSRLRQRDNAENEIEKNMNRTTPVKQTYELCLAVTKTRTPIIYAWLRRKLDCSYFDPAEAHIGRVQAYDELVAIYRKQSVAPAGHSAKAEYIPDSYSLEYYSGEFLIYSSRAGFCGDSDRILLYRKSPVVNPDRVGAVSAAEPRDSLKKETENWRKHCRSLEAEADKQQASIRNLRVALAGSENDACRYRGEIADLRKTVLAFRSCLAAYTSYLDENWQRHDADDFFAWAMSLCEPKYKVT